MKKLSQWILITGLLGSILTGCGAKDAGNTTNETTLAQKEEQTNKEQNTEKNVQNVEEEKNENTIVRKPEQNIVYQLNSETKEETAFLKNSENQPYSMYVLPEFELTSEEPGKDVLFLGSDAQTFMRIELLPTDIDWKVTEESTKAQLESINEDVQTLKAPSDEFFKNSIIMESSKDNDIVTAYIIKNEKQPLKLMIFSQKDLDYKDPFLQMGKTIVFEQEKEK